MAGNVGLIFSWAGGAKKGRLFVALNSRHPLRTHVFLPTTNFLPALAHVLISTQDQDSLDWNQSFWNQYLRLYSCFVSKDKTRASIVRLPRRSNVSNASPQLSLDQANPTVSPIRQGSCRPHLIHAIPLRPLDAQLGRTNLCWDMLQVACPNGPWRS
jgi:hypothetical protein